MADIRFDDVRVGEGIPQLTKPPVDRLQLALFAGASGDHNPIHVDETAARAAGLPGCIVHGMLTMAFLGQLLSGWVSPTRIRHWNARFLAVAVPGDSITCTGRVRGKSVVDGENVVELELAAENQRGERILLGQASVVLPGGRPA